jgi:hypothetical protein
LLHLKKTKDMRAPTLTSIASFKKPKDMRAPTLTSIAPFKKTKRYESTNSEKYCST